MTPTTTPAWVLIGQTGSDSLIQVPDRPLPPLGDHDVLVQIHAVSLNHRDLAIAEGLYGLTLPNPVIPTSDGAGTIISTGPRISALAPGDKVLTHLLPNKVYTEPATFLEIMTGLGHGVDGTLTKYAVFGEDGLVKMPGNLSFVEGSTLPCAGLTAWNALFGLKGRGGVKEGDVVLVQGTGGVSVLAMQFALSLGATVIATTSSSQKANALRTLGAQHILNYKTDPNWGSAAKSVTPHNRGVDLIVDVGGLATLPQSLAAIRPGGLVSVTGMLGGGAEDISKATLLECLSKACVARGIVLGTREQFDEMCRFVEERRVKPVVDERVWGFGETKEVFGLMKAQGHFANVCISVD